jgi:hypothetical protein
MVISAAAGWRMMMLAILVLASCGPAMAQNPAVVAGRAEPAGVVMFDGQRDACEEGDFPDAPARAFRDAAGTVHLLATHVRNRQMLGPTLQQVTHDCRVVFEGRRDPRPEARDDYGWLVAPFTLDGQTIYSLIHNEFHGNEHPPLCPSRSYLRCWDNAITWAVSRDAGYRFLRPPGARALVAALPHPYAGDRVRQTGYFNPTNIVAHAGFFYAMFTMIDAVRGDWGVCLMRTSDVSDPAGWRVWDGQGFTLRQDGPSAGGAAVPAAERCRPVGEGRLFASLGSLGWMPQAGVFVLAMRFQPWDRPRRGESPGTYLATSKDLLEWSQPVLLMADIETASSDLRQLYPSLLDPAAPDRNFQTLGPRPLLLTVEVRAARPPRERQLVARQVTLRLPR